MSFFTKKTQKNRRSVFAALDIGTNKVCCAIAKVEMSSKESGGEVLRLKGVGQHLSRGLKGGFIVDLDALESSIVNAVHTAERLAEETIEEVYVNLPSSSTTSQTIEVHLSLDNQAVDETHIRRLLALGRHNQIPQNQQIIHAIPISYSIDESHGINDPRGMFGHKLSVLLHIIVAPVSLIRNLSNCIGRCHLDVAGFVVSSYASGLSTLVNDELELGVTVIDMGGGSTSIASFLDGTLVHIDTVPLGGGHITSDIARGLATPLIQAERLKTLYGTVIASSSDDRENILVPQLGEDFAPQPHHIPKSMLVHIVRSRAEEILEHVWRRLCASGMDQLVCQRIVITGGGSQLPGIREMASTLWGKQIRIGQPIGITGLSDMATSPMFSTCSGLLQYGYRDYASENQQRLQVLSDSSRVWTRAVTWIRENF